MKAVYLAKEVLDIFDEMRYSYFFRKIIDGLQASMSRSDVTYSDRINLSKSNISSEILKQILGDDFVNEDDIEAFVHIFKEKSYKQNKEEDKKMGYWKNELQSQQEGPKLIKFTDDFWQMLDRIKPADDIVWELYSLDSNPEIKNTLGVEQVDISDKEWYFDIKQNGKPGQIKVSQFLRHYFKDKFSQDEIFKFTQKYNKIIGGSSTKQVGDLLKPREFKYEPTNVKQTFISLVTETYPMGHEEEVVPFITPGLTRDQYGNYYTIIGDSDTSFTCHLDTASRTKSKVGLINYQKDNQDFIMTDGASILGADDKSGVAILMYMIANKLLGLY